jgi:hypothetical protein
LETYGQSARFDLCIDPIDEPGHVPEWCSFTKALPSHKIDGAALQRATENSIEAAQRDFARGQSIGGIEQMFRERASMVFRRFSLENYTQTHLAWGLCLVALGQAVVAKRHLLQFCTTYDIDLDDRMLQAAIRYAGGAT